MALFGERKRRKSRDRQEAEGADFWTESLDDAARVKLVYAVRDAADNHLEFYQRVRDMTVRSQGVASLAGFERDVVKDVEEAILRASEDSVFSILEASFLVAQDQELRAAALYGDYSGHTADYLDNTREILREHRVSFDMIEGKIIEKQSEELHAEVVEPVLRLLSGREGWGSVEKAYQDALGELHNGKPEDAITDASVALEEALTLRGCKGNSLSKKLIDARKKGVLAPQDSLLGEALLKIGAWIEAERSTTGDAHNANPASREDGWFVVHITGALILRLAEGLRTP